VKVLEAGGGDQAVAARHVQIREPAGEAVGGGLVLGQPEQGLVLGQAEGAALAAQVERQLDVAVVDELDIVVVEEADGRPRRGGP
jgi:hypothetical protein